MSDTNGEILPAPPRGGILQADQYREAVEQLQGIREFISSQFVEEVDFGKIPKTDRKTLLADGALKAFMLFNCYPESEITRVEGDEPGRDDVEYIVRVRLIHRASGKTIGEGMGSCSTRESNYRFRGAKRQNQACPECGKEAVIPSKEEYGGGWYCLPKLGGCKARFPKGDERFQAGGGGDRVEVDNAADSRNTVLKMAIKRAEVHAAERLLCIGELFNREGVLQGEGGEKPQQPRQGASRPPKAETIRTPPGTPLKGRIEALLERQRPRFIERFRAQAGREPTAQEAILATAADVARHLWDEAVEKGWIQPIERGGYPDEPVMFDRLDALGLDGYADQLAGLTNSYVNAAGRQLIAEAIDDRTA